MHKSFSEISSIMILLMSFLVLTELSPVYAESPKDRRIKNIYQEVVAISSDVLGVNKNRVNIKSDFQDDLGADELDVQTIVMYSEDKFGVEFPGNLAVKYPTVGHVVAFIAGTGISEVESVVGVLPVIQPQPDRPNTSRAVRMRMFPADYRITAVNITDDTPEYYKGEILILPYSRTPVNALPGDGREVSVGRYQTLYSLISGKIRMNGSDTMFTLPDLSQSGIWQKTEQKLFIISDGPVPVRGRQQPDIRKSGIEFFPVPYKPVSGFYVGEMILMKNISGKDLQGSILPCDGRLLRVNEHRALYSLIGNQFGGDTGKTFALPDLQTVQSPVPGAKYYIRIKGRIPRFRQGD